jgi:phosphate transport system permease protein
MAEQRRTARYTARRRTDAITTTLAVGATLFGLGWLALILGSLLWHGLSGRPAPAAGSSIPSSGASCSPCLR